MQNSSMTMTAAITVRPAPVEDDQPMMMMSAMSTGPQNGDLLTSPPWDFNTATGSTNQIEYWDGGYRPQRVGTEAAKGGWSQILGDGTTPDTFWTEAEIGLSDVTQATSTTAWSYVHYGFHSGDAVVHGMLTRIGFRVATDGRILASIGLVKNGVNLQTITPSASITSTAIASSVYHPPGTRFKVRLDVDLVGRTWTAYLDGVAVSTDVLSWAPNFGHTGWRAGVLHSQGVGDGNAMTIYNFAYGTGDPGAGEQKALGATQEMSVGFSAPVSVIPGESAGEPVDVTPAPLGLGLGIRSSIVIDPPDWITPGPVHLPLSWAARIGMRKAVKPSTHALGFGVGVDRIWVMPQLPENPVLILDRLRTYFAIRADVTVNRAPVPEPEGLSIVPIRRDSRFYRLDQ